MKIFGIHSSWYESLDHSVPDINRTSRSAFLLQQDDVVLLVSKLGSLGLHFFSVIPWPPTTVSVHFLLLRVARVVFWCLQPEITSLVFNLQS